VTMETRSTVFVCSLLGAAVFALSSNVTAGPTNETLAGEALRVFGKQNGQSFDAAAATQADRAARTDSMTVVIPPGKGAELKAELAEGQAFVFQWQATGDVDVDMHGERTGAKNEYTSYQVAGAARKGAGSLKAPFAGEHGWYWRNRGNTAVTVTLTVTGFHSRLFRPTH
jgi:hypothetical protein